MSKVSFIHITDGHSGHDQGLTNPDTELKEDLPMKGEPVSKKVQLSATQKVLWDLILKGREWLGKNCRGHQKILVHHGEVVQGNDKPDNLMVGDIDEQVKIAFETFDPWMDIVDKVRLHQATTWHEYGNGSASKMVANMLKMQYKADVEHSHKTLFDVDGFLLQTSHHGPATSKRKRLEDSSAHWSAQDKIMVGVVENEPIPDLVITGHTHKPSWGTAHMLQDGQYHSCDWLISPPMCGAGAYSRKIASQDAYYVGYHIVTVIDGKLHNVEPFYARLYDYIREVV